MTVADFKKELDCYEDNQEIVFEFDDDVEVDSWTENRWGNKSVHIDKMLKPTFIGDCRGDMRIELGVSE